MHLLILLVFHYLLVVRAYQVNITGFISINNPHSPTTWCIASRTLGIQPEQYTCTSNHYFSATFLPKVNMSYTTNNRVDLSNTTIPKLLLVLPIHGTGFSYQMNPVSQANPVFAVQAWYLYAFSLTNITRDHTSNCNYEIAEIAIEFTVVEL